MKKGDDIFDVLLEAYRKELPEGEGAEETPGSKFCDFARGFLQRNPPVSTYVTERGLGVRLQDNTTVPLVKFEETPMVRDAVAVTRPQVVPGMDISDWRSTPVTGTE